MGKEGTAIYLCPACGAFISESATKCPNCGEPLDGLSEEELPKPDESVVETEVSMLDLELAVAEEIEEDGSEPVTLFLCSVCGAFTGESATKCPNCGAAMQDDEAEPELTIKPGDHEAEVIDMLVESEPEPEPAPDKAPMDELKELESGEGVVDLVEAIPYTDPDRNLQTAEAPEEIVLDLDELILDPAGEGASPMERGVEDAEPVPDAEARAREFSDNDTIALCKSCGAFVSETAEVCNVCGERISGRKFIPGPEPEKVHDASDAGATLRAMLGVSEDAVLDDEAGTRFQSDGSIGLCTVCGAFIGREAASCPVCGTHIEDMPEFMPSMDVEGPEKEDKGLAICPHCGVFVQEGATECMSCVKPIEGGAKVESVPYEDQGEQPDKAAEALRTFLRVEKVLEQAEQREPMSGGLDICPDCGAFVSINAVVCSICGSPLFEGAEEIAEIDRALSGQTKCPNCGATLAEGSSECPDCLMAFKVEEPEPDTSDIEALDLDIPAEPELDSDADPDALPVTIIEGTLDEELESLVVSESLIDELPIEEDFRDVEPVDAAIEPDADRFEEYAEEVVAAEQPVGQFPEDVSEAVTPEIAEPDEPVILEFIDAPEQDPTEVDVYETVEDFSEDADTLVGSEGPTPAPAARDLSKFDTLAPGAPRSGNWSTLVYVSVAAISFFLLAYALIPGDQYSPGLAVIFGTFTLFGVILSFTEKGTFFKGDARQASLFYAGISVAASMLLIPALMPDEADGGILSGSGLSTIVLSLAILLVSVGTLWMRARVRYVFTWFGGSFLIFLGTTADFAMGVSSSGPMSPVALTAGLGAGLVFAGFIFLLYERALNTSIESDIVRGDAHYLRRDYVKALSSYDDALAKAQIRKVDVIGSPLVEYDVPWYSKGSALILMGEFEEGIRCLDMALAINPNNEVTWVGKGNAHTKLGEHELAMECYSRAIECNPFYEIAWNNLGNAHARRKEYVEALKHYNRALKINPKYDDAWINKGYVLAKMGRRDAAVKCLDHVGSRAAGKPAQVERDVHTL